ncbi:Serine/threonine-protein kinase pim-2 [Durusdinium trenchii]|uniref:Serine/threonine-protein kinase pim-2 n=1 Tax=Durusdinium trenchii TaxID=1381693 RepID=A0ABP0NMP5_9DINO
MYTAWLVFAVAIPVRSNICDSSADNVCMINVSKHVAGPDRSLSYAGKVLITKGCNIVSDDWFRIDATGDVTVENGSTIHAKGDLVINASGIHIRNSNLTSSLSRLELLSSASSAYANSTFSSATSRVSLDQLQDSNNTMGIVIADSCLKGSWMNMTCNKSGVNLEGSAALSTDARQLLQIRASTVEAGSKSTLTAGIISISTESSLQLEARILVGFATKQTPSEPPELQLTTQGSMTLGSSQYQWILSGLTASAQNLEITASSSVSIQHDTTCHNNGTKVADRCQGVLGSWATTTGAWPPSADGDVSFNLVLLARESLTIAQAARLQAASAFLCSNQMNVDDQSVIDVSGGGGLIWLSAQAITFGKAVRLDAAGSDGTAGSDKKLSFASAGGSGGQILIFVGSLQTPAAQADQPTITATGGKGACIQQAKIWVVSGAGGGGAIGMNWSTPTSTVGLKHDVEGGKLDLDSKGSSCNLIPTKELLDSTYGQQGDPRDPQYGRKGAKHQSSALAEYVDPGGSEQTQKSMRSPERIYLSMFAECTFKALNKAAEVGKMSARVEAVLKRLFPPLAPLFARCQRHCRAQAIIDVLNTESLSVGTDRLWKWMREPGNDFLLRFGCDRKASLAHLDFLDFAKSRLDWAPVNLLKEAWLIPVHGQGTFVEPFEVDISDPVLQLLEHTDFGPTAVLSVISTFNRAARIISKD